MPIQRVMLLIIESSNSNKATRSFLTRSQ